MKKIFTSEKRPTEWSTKIIIIGEKTPLSLKKRFTMYHRKNIFHFFMLHPNSSTSPTSDSKKNIFFNKNLLQKNPITPPTHDERDEWILRTRDAEDEPPTAVDRKRKLKLSYSRRRQPDDRIDHDRLRDHTVKGKNIGDDTRTP